MKEKKTRALKKSPSSGGKQSSSQEISTFLTAAKKTDSSKNGRLIFSLDATMSRQPSWNRAMEIQAAMFDAVGRAGGLSVQLVYFRGLDECRASKWVVNSAALRDLMVNITCRGGYTQIEKVLRHVNRETAKARVAAVVFIGDAIEEGVDRLCNLAGELGLKGVRCFFFQEGAEVDAERAFREMARLTNGAWFHLGPDSARQLAQLLGAIALYAQGGLPALSDSRHRGARLLLEQLKR